MFNHITNQTSPFHHERRPNAQQSGETILLVAVLILVGGLFLVGYSLYTGYLALNRLRNRRESWNPFRCSGLHLLNPMRYALMGFSWVIIGRFHLDEPEEKQTPMPENPSEKIEPTRTDTTTTTTTAERIPLDVLNLNEPGLYPTLSFSQKNTETVHELVESIPTGSMDLPDWGSPYMTILPFTKSVQPDAQPPQPTSPPVCEVNETDDDVYATTYINNVAHAVLMPDEGNDGEYDFVPEEGDVITVRHKGSKRVITARGKRREQVLAWIESYEAQPVAMGSTAQRTTEPKADRQRTLKDMRAEAKSKGIKGFSRMNRQQLNEQGVKS